MSTASASTKGKEMHFTQKQSSWNTKISFQEFGVCTVSKKDTRNGQSQRQMTIKENSPLLVFSVIQIKDCVVI